MKCPFKRNIIEGENYTGNKATKVTFGDCEKDCMAHFYFIDEKCNAKEGCQMFRNNYVPMTLDYNANLFGDDENGN